MQDRAKHSFRAHIPVFGNDRSRDRASKGLKTSAHLARTSSAVVAVFLLAALSGFFADRSFADSPDVAVDVHISEHQRHEARTLASSKFSTASDDELLLAFINSNGENTRPQTISSVTGGGLAWTLRVRSNAQGGTSEIWQAVARKQLSHVAVTATRSYGCYDGDITIVSFTGADLSSMSVVAAADGRTSTPTVSLTTTRDNSWVWATGNDWDRSASRTVGTGQSLMDEFAHRADSTTYWTQNQTSHAQVSGTEVVMSNSVPTTDRWNFASIEVLPAVSTPVIDRTAPSVPANLRAVAVDESHINLAWTASTDNVGTSGYDIFRGEAKLATTEIPEYRDIGLAPATAYSYYVTAHDPAGNTSAQTPSVRVKTPVAGGDALTIQSLTPGTSWQWQVDGRTINESILDSVSNSKKMYDIDMERSDAETIARLKAKGIYVVCYMETGAWETYRSDAASFPDNIKGKSMGGYPNEKWIDIRQASIVGPIMAARMDRARAKGCQGIEPDLDDSYTEDTGFPLTMKDQIAYDTAMIDLAHSKGMSMGLKNGPGIAEAMAPIADWALSEECNKFKECDGYSAFITLNKAVFNVEYTTPDGMTVAKFCQADNAANFDGLLKKSSETLAALPRTACRFE